MIVENFVMPEIGVLVSVNDEHLDRLLEVSEQLQSRGMKLNQLLDQLGIITGSIDSTKIDDLQDIEGVSHVEQEKEFDAI